MLDIIQVDAFTAQSYAGNPAAVVLDAGGLSDSQMQAIAREMNLSETAFVSPADMPGADFRLRWMTPGVEVNFCGHATVATVHVMQQVGRLPSGRVVFQTRKGLLPVAVEDGWIWLEPAVIEPQPANEDLAQLLDAFGLSAADLADWAPPVIGGERDILIPCRTLDALRRAVPEGARLTALGRERGWRAYCLTTLETIEPSSSTHTRFFAPQSGVLEDPVTGSVHASLAVYVTGAGQAPDRFIAEQGDLIGRPGRLRIEVERPSPGAKPTRVRIGGQAVTVLTGSLTVPETSGLAQTT